MKKFGIVFFAAILWTSLGFAQKFGYVDTKYIMQQMPEYKEAQQELDKFSNQWQQELDDVKAEIDQMYSKYQKDEVLLTEEMKRERQDAIIKREKELRELSRKYFGPEGQLFLKQKELIQPVQDLVFESVEKIAKKFNLQIVFDKSGDLVMIYTNPVHDYTDYVLEDLGLLEVDGGDSK